MLKKTLLIILLLSFLFAQKKDSTKTYILDEIVIKTGSIEKVENLSIISNKTLENIDSDNLMEISKKLPSIKFQVNSRGENQIYFCGAGKRQLAVVFEGNNLNNPWDNLIDFSQIPIEAIANISLTKGIPSVTHGINSLAGVLIINPKEFDGIESKSLKLGLGSEGYKRFSFNRINGFSNFSYFASLGYKKTDDIISSKTFNNETDLRKNSYNENFDFYSKLNHKYNNLEIRFSYFDTNSKKSVPTELFVSKPRYWKYPLWNQYTFYLNGNPFFKTLNTIFLTDPIVFTYFILQINDYTDHNYNKINLGEINFDNFINLKLLFNHFLTANSTIKFIFSASSMLHKKKFHNFKINISFFEKYAHDTYRLGSEYGIIKANFNNTIGLNFERINTHKYGNKLIKNDYQDYTFVSYFNYKQSNNIFFKFNIGRKIIYPSLRESYSFAQGKFEVNPELKPKTASSLDLQINYYKINFYSNIIFFLNNIKEGINRVTTRKGKFIRINKDMIRTYEIELSTNYKLNSLFYLSSTFTYINSYARNSDSEYRDTLEYKPEFIDGLNIEITPNNKLTLSSKFSFVSKEFGLQDSNLYFHELPSYFFINFRATSILNFNKPNIESYIRINNITDKLFYAQWGHPQKEHINMD